MLVTVSFSRYPLGRVLFVLVRKVNYLLVSLDLLKFLHVLVVLLTHSNFLKSFLTYIRRFLFQILKNVLLRETIHVPLDEVLIDETMHFVEKPVEIMDRKDKETKRSRIPLVKVRWESKRGAEFTWEREDQMRM